MGLSTRVALVGSLLAASFAKASPAYAPPPAAYSTPDAYAVPAPSSSTDAYAVPSASSSTGAYDAPPASSSTDAYAVPPAYTTPAYVAPSAAANGTTGGVVYATEVVTDITTYCPGPTTLTYGDKTYTITEATTLTITDCPCTLTKPVSKPAATSSAAPKDKCVEKCDHAYDVCRTEPGANRASCAADYASCLGYSPYGSDGSLITPTACSSKKPQATAPVYTTEVVTALTTYCPGPTVLHHNNITYSITEATTFTITDCPCTLTKPVASGPAPSGAVSSGKVPSGAVPTGAASVTGSAGATVPVVPTGTGYEAVPTTPAPVVTGAAARLVPAGALLALGAMILV